MKKLLLCALFLMLCVGSAFSSEKNYAEGEVLVVFKAPEGVKVSVSGLGEGGMLRASVQGPRQKLTRRFLITRCRTLVILIMS